MKLRPTGRAPNGGLAMQQSAGDTLAENISAVSIATVGAGVLTAAGIVAGLIDRTGPTAGYTDTFDSATNILTAAGNLEVGMSFNFTVVNGVAFALTAAAGEGIDLGSNVDIAASLVRVYNVNVVNNTERQAYAVDTATSDTVSGLTAEQIDTLSVGMMVSGSGVTAGTTVSALNRADGELTLSAATSSSLTGTLLVFSPTLAIRGLFSATA